MPWSTWAIMAIFLKSSLIIINYLFLLNLRISFNNILFFGYLLNKIEFWKIFFQIYFFQFYFNNMVKLKFIIFSADNINIKNIVLPVITLKSNIIYFRIFHMNFEYGFNFYLCIIVVFIVHFNIEIWERIKFFKELIKPLLPTLTMARQPLLMKCLNRAVFSVKIRQLPNV